MTNVIVTKHLAIGAMVSVLTATLTFAGTMSSPAEAADQRLSGFGCTGYHIDGMDETIERDDLFWMNHYHGFGNEDTTYRMQIECHVPDNTTFPKANADAINFHGYDAGANNTYCAYEASYNAYSGSAVCDDSSATGYHTVTINTPWSSASAYGHITVWLPAYSGTGTVPSFKGAYIYGY